MWSNGVDAALGASGKIKKKQEKICMTKPTEKEVTAIASAAGVPVAPIDQPKTAEADRNRQWREVGVGAQILRDLGVTSIRHLTSSAHDYKGLSGFGIEIVSNERLEG